MFPRLPLVKVTLDNFSEKLPEVLSAVEDASFVAVDGEFTGIQLDSSSRHMPFDTAEERYEKLAEGARRFQLVQFGLCTFHYDREGDCYSNQAFNFYVWPRPYARNAPDRKFLCQASSLDFLMSQVMIWYLLFFARFCLYFHSSRRTLTLTSSSARESPTSIRSITKT